ncbi:MAG: DMT family transporter [Rickettsiales bacterium]
MLMLVDTLAISSLYATTKFVTQDIKSNYVVFFYKFTLLILTLPWILQNGGIKNIRTPYFKVHLLRGFFSVGGSLCFMYGLQTVNLLDATVLQNIEQIILVAVGILFFHEKANKTKGAAIIISLIGVLIIIKPEIIFSSNQNLFQGKVDRGYIFIFVAAMFWVGNNIVIKKLGKKSTNKAQLFYLMFFSSLFAFPVAFLKWQSHSVFGIDFYLPADTISFDGTNIKPSHLKLILLMSLFYLVHSVALFNSLKFGEFSVVMPFVYFKLIWSGVLGYIIFANMPNVKSIIGYSLVALAGILLMRKEMRRRKKIVEEAV